MLIHNLSAKMLLNPYLKAKHIWMEVVLKVERIYLPYQDTHTVL